MGVCFVLMSLCKYVFYLNIKDLIYILIERVGFCVILMLDLMIIVLGFMFINVGFIFMFILC